MRRVMMNLPDWQQPIAEVAAAYPAAYLTVYDGGVAFEICAPPFSRVVFVVFHASCESWACDVLIEAIGGRRPVTRRYGVDPVSALAEAEAWVAAWAVAIASIGDEP